MAKEHRTGCLLCGKELQYLPQPREIPCAMCGRPRSNAPSRR